jgi:hypothetical protein
MTVQGSNQMVDVEDATLQSIVPQAGGGDHREASAQRLQPDQVIVSDFTRIALLTPPNDTEQLNDLQQKVYTGEYGPPAATIAEALITRAILSGVSA